VRSAKRKSWGFAMRSAASDIGGDLTLPKLLAPTIRVAQSVVKSKEENDAYVPPRGSA